jgi:hypothetical protein
LPEFGFGFEFHEFPRVAASPYHRIPLFSLCISAWCGERAMRVCSRNLNAVKSFIQRVQSHLWLVIMFSFASAVSKWCFDRPRTISETPATPATPPRANFESFDNGVGAARDGKKRQASAISENWIMRG